MIHEIWKYPIPVRNDVHAIQVPHGAKFRSAVMQNGVLVLYAEVNPDAPAYPHAVTVAGTGVAFDPLLAGEYIGTVQEEIFVWHVYVREGSAA